MKKIFFLLAAVLLFAVLLFFLKEPDIFRKEGQPESTPVPTPEIKEPEVLENAWIVSSTEASITYFFEGEQKTLSTKGKLQEPLESVVGDLTVQGEEIVSLVVKPDKITAKVLRADANSMELEGYGILPLAEGFRVYRLYDGVAEEPSEKILVGTEDTEFILEGGTLCAGILVKKPELRYIRVLIGTNGYEGYYHEEIEVTGTCGFTVVCGETKETYAAGERYRLTKESFQKDTGRRVIVPEKVDGKLTVCHLKRSSGAPSYRGTLEVECREEGLLLVNEVTMEEYLYGVLPSEMPSSFGMEALKAQAICARSYAYTELLANRYAAYGAHVDDSVASQVYNNTGETEASILAVKETHGQVLMYGDEVAQCYYFSTSAGHTASVTDVWEYAKEVTYLSGKPTTYDADSPWYRWQTFLSFRELEENMEQALKERYAAVPEQILTYDAATETFVSKPIAELGSLQRIRVEERGKGGIATQLLIVGSKGVYLVKKEYNIRSMLAPLGKQIYRGNGETVSGAALLPSAFFTLQKGMYREETGYLVTGGGYGHGVGMSQCGANAMAQAGYSCEDIINEYYPGTELGFIYQ